MDNDADDDAAARPTRRQWAYFTCPDCQARLTRLIRVDPRDPLRCFACEAQQTRRVSNLLLSQVFGGPLT